MLLGKMLYFTDLLYTASALNSEYVMPYTTMNNHNGQVKLFLSEVLFFERYVTTPNAHIVYAGAAPGQHIQLLSKMYPNFTFHLYDPAPFAISESSNVHITQLPFTLDTANHLRQKLEGKSVYLISDVRRATTASNFEREIFISTDMRMQQSWHEALSPEYSMLKFRLPLPDYETSNLVGRYAQYLNGALYRQAFAPKTSTELRLVASKDSEQVWYDTIELDVSMSYYNGSQRVSSKYANPIIHMLRSKGYAQDKSQTSIDRLERKTLPLYTSARLRRGIQQDTTIRPEVLNNLVPGNWDDTYCIYVLAEYFINRGYTTAIATLTAIDKLVHVLLSDLEQLHPNEVISRYELGSELPRVEFDSTDATGFLSGIIKGREKIESLFTSNLYCKPTKNTFTRFAHLLVLEGKYNGLSPSLRQSKEALLPFAVQESQQASAVIALYAYLKYNESIHGYTMSSSMSDTEILRLAISVLYEQVQIASLSLSGSNRSELILAKEEETYSDAQLFNTLYEAMQEARSNTQSIYTQLDSIFSNTAQFMTDHQEYESSVRTLDSLDARFAKYSLKFPSSRKPIYVSVLRSYIADTESLGIPIRNVVVRLALNSVLYAYSAAGFNRSLGSNAFQALVTSLAPTESEYATFELYADMFNSYGKNFASAFPSLDGAIGTPSTSLQHLMNYNGELIIQANPPYLLEYYYEFLTILEQLMSRSAATSVVLFVPSLNPIPELDNAYVTDSREIRHGSYVQSGKEVELTHMAIIEEPVQVYLYQNVERGNTLDAVLKAVDAY